jgi:transglutaminase-like putative cysteine protease
MKLFFCRLTLAFILTFSACQHLAADTVVAGQKAPLPFINRSQVLREAKQVTVSKYPDADSVLLRDVQKVKYEADGSSIEHDEFYNKILTEKGKRGAEVLTEYFNVSYGTTKVLAIEIIKADGRTVKIDVAKNSKTMIYSGQMGANIYNPNAKILSVTVPGVEIGDIMYYFVERIKSRAYMENTWTDVYTVQSTTPVLYYNIIIDGPKERPLKKYLVKDPVKDSVSFSKKEVGDRIIYNWTFRNIPRIFPEPQMPSYYRYAERLLVSTAESWSEISTWYNRLCAPHLAKVTPAMEEKVKELTKGLKTETEKIEAVFRFVSNKIRYMGITIETTAPGYEPHDIDLTFNNRYGVCRDKAALLAGMLRLAGIKAYPVLIMAGTKKDEEVPNNFFNHAITCAITEDGKTVLMDSTNESTMDLLPAYLSDKSYLIALPSGSELMTSPVVPASKNLLRAETSGELHEDGSLTAATELKFDGINDTIYRGAFSRWKKERIKQYFAAKLKSIMPGAKLECLKVTPENLRDFKTPLSVKFNFTTNSLLIPGKGVMLMQVPQVGASFSAVNWLLGDMGLKKRQYPLLLAATCGVVEKFSYKMPVGLRVAKFPEYKKIDWQKLLWERTETSKDNCLAGTSKYLLNAVEFLPDEYLKLKKNIEEIEFENRKMLIVEKDFGEVKNLEKLFPAAQSVIISQKSLIDIKDRHSSTIRTRIKKKILNYGGVKSNSEIKLYYNPAWQNVSISSVTVTTPEGKELKLNENEKNIMDQSWIGGAPRYPAGKILVVSLPGVRPGSTVEYELLIENTRQPFISSSILFRNSNPILSKEVTLQYPENLKLKISPPAECRPVSRTVEKGKVIQKWLKNNIAAVPAEMHSPPLWLFVPKLVFSGGNWQEYSKDLKNRLEKAAENQKDTEAMTAKLIEGKTPLDAIKEIRDYAAKNIRLAGPGLSSLPLSCISYADKTLNDGYGNSPDRAVLIYAMLKKAGFKPEFLPVAQTPAIPQALRELEEYPVNDLSTVLVKFVHQGKTYYLNDTSQYAQLGSCRHENDIVLNLNSAKLETLKLQEEAATRLELEYSLKLIGDGSTLISYTASYYGSQFESNNRLFSEISPEERKRHFEKAVSQIAQSAVPMTKFSSDFKTYPGEVHYAVKIPDYIIKDGKYLYFKLPMDYLSSLISTGNEKRENPYFQHGRRRLRIKYLIDLPDNTANIVIQPESCAVTYPQQGGEIKITTTRVSPKRLQIIYDIDLKPCLVPVDEYGLLVNAQTMLSKPGLKTIMLVTK